MNQWLSAAEWPVLLLSLKVSVVAVLLTLPLAYALAWLLARRSGPGRRPAGPGSPDSNSEFAGLRVGHGHGRPGPGKPGRH